MKLTGSLLKGVVLILALGIAVYAATMRQRFKSRSDFAERVISFGPSTETIAELRNAIALYEKRITRHVEDAAKTGSYWKILAIRLQDRGLNGEALVALENALYYNPADPVLHYLTGVSAGIVAKSFHALPGSEEAGRMRYLAAAEEAYLRAVELDGAYLKPRYGLGVLYVFELDRPEEAVSHLKRCLEITRNDIDAMFVLARAFYMMGNYREAIELYDRIIILTMDERRQLEARENRQTVMEIIYG